MQTKLVVLAIVLGVILQSCEVGVETINLTKPAVLSISRIEQVSATKILMGIKIDYDGGFEITEKGVCFSLTHAPSIDGLKVVKGEGYEDFQAEITDLSPDTKYFLRPYAISAYGVSYGKELEIVTMR